MSQFGRWFRSSTSATTPGELALALFGASFFSFLLVAISVWRTQLAEPPLSFLFGALPIVGVVFFALRPSAFGREPEPNPVSVSVARDRKFRLIALIIVVATGAAVWGFGLVALGLCLSSALVFLAIYVLVHARRR